MRGLDIQAGWLQTQFLNGVILLLVIIFLPNGLVSLFNRWARRPTPLASEAGTAVEVKVDA